MGENRNEKIPWYRLDLLLESLDPDEGTDLGDLGKRGQEIGEDLKKHPDKHPPFN